MRHGYKKRIIQFYQSENTLLFGVRSSGKTYLLNQRFPPPEAKYIDLLDQQKYQSYLSDISKFYEEITASGNSLIIVDEIQKIPDLLNEVHRLIEQSARGESIPRRFILTGSSMRKLKAPNVNLLAGRMGKLYLHPFVPEELGDDFNLDIALRYGMLPIVWSSGDRSRTLNRYVETYLREEIKAEALVRNLPGFTRFLEVASLCHGQTVNMSSIATKCEISHQSVRDFFSILEDTRLGFFLLPYSSTTLRIREKKQKKFYLIDPGIARTLKKNFGPVSNEEKGFLFEGLIAQLLRAYKDYYNIYEDIFYWSPAEAKKTEVDFLLKRKNDDLIAIEVKSNTQVSSKDYKGLKAIKDLPSVKKRIVIYLGKDIRKTEEGIEIWPFEFFCENLTQGNDFSTPVSQKKTKPPVYSNSSIGNILTPSRLQTDPPSNYEDFERLCLDLYSEEVGKDCRRNGTRGQRQDGVDIFSTENSVGIQCKEREKDKKIKEEELREEVEKAKNFKTLFKAIYFGYYL